MTFDLLRNYKKDKQFYRNLFLITIPIIMQNLITTSLNMLDTMMIGKVGEIELASVGIANQFYFLFTLFAFGAAGGGGVLIAQLWGKGDKDNINKILCKSLILGFLMSITFTIIGLFIPDQIISIFNKEAQVVIIGSSYLKITVISYVFTGITFVFSSALRSVGETKLPMFASLFGLIVNALLNYMLIFGNFGMPRLETTGAAIATLIARIFECAIIVIVVRLKHDVLNINFKDFSGLPAGLKKTLSRVTIPIVINEAGWGFGNVTYMAIYANISARAAASMQICSTIMNLFMIIAFGLSYASLVIIGNEIGASREDIAIESSKKIVVLSFWTGLFLGGGLLFAAKPIVSFFNVSAEVKTASTYVLYIFSVCMPLRVVNMVMIVGILRGGGDATYASVLEGVSLWVVGIPLVFIAASVLGMPVYVAFAFTTADELTKIIFLVKRFKSGKWIQNMVNDTIK
ncbi:putative MATE family efflux protein [Sedimentibacter acidaminivorans]|uniref:Probable multidrug resistance protein NorM n=1 Tax=Sedimentibacter acidaminivorans TaxID=913099 RepID=A0ABS4GA82_9FIRM|nr:MATE family efflux transporter [Sedimentibacter acidaminivorans]MBP1924315.1 putative MATE family efflux protein [Sedimentibacter acidaminivorans]